VTDQQAAFGPELGNWNDMVDREMDRYIDLWKLADARIINTVTPAIALGAGLVPAAVALSALVSDVRLFLLVCVPVISALAILLVLLSIRATSVTMVKQLYLLAVDVLSQWYVNEAPTLQGCRLFLPVKKTSLTVGYVEMRLSPPRPRIAVGAMVIASAALTGTSAAIVAWWLWRKWPQLAIVAAGLVAGSVELGGVLRILEGHQRSECDRLLSRIDLTSCVGSIDVGE
jgi:hypothetical protein